MNEAEIRAAVAGQFEAALAMLNDCLKACPDEHWDGLIAKYPFWHVGYHTLCFVDAYLSRNQEAFEGLVAERVARRAADPSAPDFQPRGMAELEDEHPSRRFDRAELLEYAAYCAAKVREVLREGHDEPLGGPSGFWRLKFSRLELHLYNLRHVQHHAGALGAFLRRQGVDLRWVGSGRPA